MTNQARPIAIHLRDIIAHVYVRHGMNKCSLLDFEDLPTDGEHLTYGAPEIRTSKHGAQISRQRVISQKRSKGKPYRLNASLIWNLEKKRLSVYARKTKADLIVNDALVDIQSLHTNAGCKGVASVYSTRIHLEEFCTWINDDDLEVVIAKLPVLIKYAETLGWGVDANTNQGWILIRNLRFPALSPENDTK